MAKRKSGRSRPDANKASAKTGKRRAGTAISRKKSATAKKKVTGKKSAPASGRKAATTKKKSAPVARKKASTATKKKSAPVAKAKATASTATKKTVARRSTAKRVRPTGGGPKPPQPRSPARSALAESDDAQLGITIAGIEIAARSKPLPKTKLTAKQLRGYKELLLAKRRELLGDVTQLSNEALHTSRQESRGDLSNMPSHMADMGSDNWEQEFTLGLIATERVLLRQIDGALERIRNRTYGVCVATHCMISPERLQAKPWAQYCIEFARLRDSGRIPPGLV